MAKLDLGEILITKYFINFLELILNLFFFCFRKNISSYVKYIPHGSFIRGDCAFFFCKLSLVSNEQFADNYTLFSPEKIWHWNSFAL